MEKLYSCHSLTSEIKRTHFIAAKTAGMNWDNSKTEFFKIKIEKLEMVRE
jgi:hypothetical protein